VEYLAASPPEARVYGRDVYPARKRLGELLAQEFPVRADAVVPFPGSEIAAIGFAGVLGLPVEHVLRRAPERAFPRGPKGVGGASGWALVASLVARRRVALVTDGLRQGQAIQRVGARLRSAGALEVHVRIAAPALVGRCPYGVELGDPEQFAGRRFDAARLRAWLDVDSVAFLTASSLRQAIAGTADPEAARLCAGCLSGEYPVEPVAGPEEVQVPLFRS
jgi:amidophosphoribosyltransferase